MKRNIILLLALIAIVMSSCNNKSKSEEAMAPCKDAVESTSDINSATEGQQENSKNAFASRE